MLGSCLPSQRAIGPIQFLSLSVPTLAERLLKCPKVRKFRSPPTGAPDPGPRHSAPEPNFLDETEQSIPRIAETREDVALLVQLAIHGAHHDGQVGVILLQPFQPLRRAQQSHERKIDRPRGLELADCLGGAAAGGNHGVQHEDRPRFQERREVAVVGNGRRES